MALLNLSNTGVCFIGSERTQEIDKYSCIPYTFSSWGNLTPLQVKIYSIPAFFRHKVEVVKKSEENEMKELKNMKVRTVLQKQDIVLYLMWGNDLLLLYRHCAFVSLRAVSGWCIMFFALLLLAKLKVHPVIPLDTRVVLGSTR